MRRNRATYIIVTISMALVVASLILSNCGREATTSDQKQAQKTEVMLEEAERQIGMANITNFQQRKLMKLIYELCDQENLVCYAYIKSDYHGKLFFIGKCMGYGIPFSAQFTNPEKIVHGDHQLGYDLAGRVNHPMKLPQADPNGLFMPTASSATWLMMIDPKTDVPRPVYIEPEIVVSPFPLH